MQLDTGDIRQNYHHFNQWLNQQSIEQLNVLNAQATAHFYKKGITFIVYSDEYGTERVIPFDIIPRIIEKEWSIMEAGCKQRILALNAFYTIFITNKTSLKQALFLPNKWLRMTVFSRGCWMSICRVRCMRTLAGLI